MEKVDMTENYVAPIPAAAASVIATASGATTIARDAVLAIVRAAILCRGSAPTGRADHHPVGERYEVHALTYLSSIHAFALETMPDSLSPCQVRRIASAANLVCSATAACLHDVAEGMSDISEEIQTLLSST